MKVYCVVKSSAWDYSLSIDVLKLTCSIEEAKLIISKEFELAKEGYDIDDSDLENQNIECEQDENGLRFSIYPSGYFAENHIECFIQVKDLDCIIFDLGKENEQ